jgi:hypothetical protein
MEVRLNAGLQAKLTRLATQQGRDSESLVVEAVELMVKNGSCRKLRKDLPPPTAVSL